MGYAPTQEQEAIINFVPELLNNPALKSIGVKAFAGCGKSSTGKAMVQTYKEQRFLGLAFNNGIVSENRDSFPKRNCKWFSNHTFAKEHLVKNGVSIDFANSRSSYKVLELIEILGIKDSDYTLANSIAEVMKVFSQSSLREITPELILKAGRSQINPNIMSMNSAYLEASCEHSRRLWDKFEANKIPPTFDFYLKYFEVNRFAEKIDHFDMLLLDEAQDSNAVSMSIASQLPTKNIFVGDDHQSIYGFRGTLNAMNYTDKLFYLSTTFRYQPSIANYANKILSTFKNENVPIKSMAKEGGHVDGVTAFLSRNNSSMIALIDDMIKKEVFFKTAKKPEELFAAALALLEYRLDKKVTDKNFLYLRNFQDIEQVEEYIQETGDNELKTAYKMQKRYGKRLYVLLKIAKQNYASKEKTKHVLSTAHTSKGLEWDRVELLNDFPDILKLIKDAKIQNSVELMKRAKSNDPVANAIVQEINLFYVAITRARFNVDLGKDI